MANLNVAKVQLGGRITVDPQLRKTPSGVSVTSFGVAVNRKEKDGQQVADFYDCVAWRGTAEFISKFFNKGSSIYLTGNFQISTWTDEKGTKRNKIEIVVDEAFFVDSKPDTAPAAEPEFTPIADEDDLPFDAPAKRS